MRLTSLSWSLLFIAACSSRTPIDAEDFDGGLDASADHGAGGSRAGTGGTGGKATGGSGGSTGGTGPTGGTGGSTGGTGGSTGGTGGSTGGTGGSTGGTGGSAGKGGGTAGVGGSAGTGGSGGSAGIGGTAGKAGSGGSAGFGGSAGKGGSGGAGGIAGTGGFGGTGGAWDGGTGGSFGGTGGAWDGGTGGSFGGTGGAWDGGAGGTGGAWDAGNLPPWNDAVCPAGGASPLLGNWVGYVENHKFASGSDALHLNISGTNGSTICGTLTYGDTTALPPPDPNVGYPLGVDITQWPPSMLPFERFPHSLNSGTVSGKRVTFQTLSYEIFRGWCGQQKSYPDSWNNRYTCLADSNWTQEWNSDGGSGVCYFYDPNTGTRLGAVDCGKAYECTNWNVCYCNQAGCGADTTYPLNFDAQFDAGEARGSVVLYTPNGQQVFNVYFTKTD